MKVEITVKCKFSGERSLRGRREASEFNFDLWDSQKWPVGFTPRNLQFINNKISNYPEPNFSGDFCVCIGSEPRQFDILDLWDSQNDLWSSQNVSQWLFQDSRPSHTKSGWKVTINKADMSENPWKSMGFTVWTMRFTKILSSDWAVQVVLGAPWISRCNSQ